ncbi:MAG: hypothetical protein ACR2KO_15580 [Geodermatophilaceae bacterium]|jgi:hypothetical protein
MVAQPPSEPTEASTARAGTPAEQIQRLYEDAESRASEAMEGLVASNGFAELLSLLTSNVVALIKVGGDAADTLIRTLRLAGRSDVARLSRQLARTEDKLELVLQELRLLQDREPPPPPRRPMPRAKP